MANALLARAREAHGFTLIELMVVALIIGILAAVAIPSFLGQTLNAKDASAKSNVKNLSSMVEECKLQSPGMDYTACNSDAELGGTPGLDWGSGPGQVGMMGNDPDVYITYAVSESRTGSTNHVFYIVKDVAGPAYRVCGPENAGGCPSGFFW